MEPQEKITGQSEGHARVEHRGRMMAARGKAIPRAKRAAAAAMAEMGIPNRQVAAELGICKSSAANLAHEPGVEGAEIEAVRNQLIGKMVRASDSFLDRALAKIKDLGPYQAMLCSGIAFDKHLAGTMAAKAGNGAGILVQILTLIDQSTRIIPGTTSPSDHNRGDS